MTSKLEENIHNQLEKLNFEDDFINKKVFDRKLQTQKFKSKLRQ